MFRECGHWFKKNQFAETNQSASVPLKVSRKGQIETENIITNTLDLKMLSIKTSFGPANIG